MTPVLTLFLTIIFFVDPFLRSISAHSASLPSYTDTVRYVFSKLPYLNTSLQELGRNQI